MSKNKYSVENTKERLDIIKDIMIIYLQLLKYQHLILMLFPGAVSGGV